jgi:hypothetical protein
LYLENREREEERAEEEPDLSDLPQYCTFAASGSSFSNLHVLQLLFLSSYLILTLFYLLELRLYLSALVIIFG